MVERTIDGRPLAAPEGTTVLRAALDAGIEIPHLCGHPGLAPEGSCRMCVVEVAGSPKLEPACATPVRPGLAVTTTGPRVAAARRDVLELLLAEHPLDCPVCDKAGECRLQDYYERYGRFPARSREERARRDKRVRLGKSLLLDRERCVLCTRCVRFLRQVPGTGELGVFERGLRSEVGIVEGRPVDDNYSGNLVDLCPVGAIGDLTTRFRARAWTLRPVETVCHLCSRGCSILVDLGPPDPAGASRPRVHRVRPKPDPAANGDWICDTGRYGYPTFEQNRLERALIRRTGVPTEASADEVFSLVARRLRRLRSGGAERGGLTVVLHSKLTGEELALARRLFVERLGARVVFVDPPAEKPDGLLYTGVRAANARGVRDAGFDPAEVGWDAIRRGTGSLLMFGAVWLAARFRTEELREGLNGMSFSLLAAAHATGLERLVDAVLPLAAPPEKSGTYANVDGTPRTLRPVVPPPGASLPEGEIFRRLERDLEGA